MAQVKSERYSKRKIKLFVFFLVLAGIFWVLTKFSREFTTSMTATIDYENIPETAALSQDNLHQISFELTANGFEIIYYKMKNPKLEIDVQKYYEEGQRSFVVPRNELVKIIASRFNKYMGIKNLSVDGLKVKLDPIILKKVAVHPRTDITFKDGFKPIDSFKIVPDSVIISGPEGLLQKINGTRTETLSLKNVEKSISASLNILSPSEDIVNIKPKEVLFEWPVAEFSQGKFTLPVEVINLPPGVELKLVPKRVSVSFDIPVADFASVSRENFRVVCDYSKRNDADNFMLPILAKQPAEAVNIVFDPRKIDYFIFK